MICSEFGVEDELHTLIAYENTKQGNYACLGPSSGLQLPRDVFAFDRSVGLPTPANEIPRDATILKKLVTFFYDFIFASFLNLTKLNLQITSHFIQVIIYAPHFIHDFYSLAFQYFNNTKFDAFREISPPGLYVGRET